VTALTPDERESIEFIAERAIAGYRDTLRARVESLVEYGCPEWEVEEGDDLGRHLRRDQVLALIDGVQA
jgi:hypothetical protein